MSETLVVNHTDVDVGCEFLTGDAGIHWFVAVVVVPSGQELIAKVADGGVLLGESSFKDQ